MDLVGQIYNFLSLIQTSILSFLISMNIVSWKLSCLHRLKCSDCWVLCIGWRRGENGKTSFNVKIEKKNYFNLEKLHFTILNYAPDYTLHSKLFEHTVCTLNYHTYNILHLGVTFAIMFNRMLLHMHLA